MPLLNQIFHCLRCGVCIADQNTIKKILIAPSIQKNNAIFRRLKLFKIFLQHLCAQEYDRTLCVRENFLYLAAVFQVMNIYMVKYCFKSHSFCLPFHPFNHCRMKRTVINNQPILSKYYKTNLPNFLIHAISHFGSCSQNFFCGLLIHTFFAI